MAAQPYQIIGSEVVKDSANPAEVVQYIVAFGKSTDTKPTEDNFKIAMGSTCKEIDTDDTYYWDTETSAWIKPGGSD